jgi:hypothetical protein
MLLGERWPFSSPQRVHSEEGHLLRTGWYAVGPSASSSSSCQAFAKLQNVREAMENTVYTGCRSRRAVSRALQLGPGGAFDPGWVPPVGGAPGRHTGIGGAADGVHDQCLMDSGAGESSGAPSQAARQAARRGDVDQPRRCAGRRAGRQAGAHRRRGEDSPPPTRPADLRTRSVRLLR